MGRVGRSLGKLCLSDPSWFADNLEHHLRAATSLRRESVRALRLTEAPLRHPQNPQNPNRQWSETQF